MTVRTTGAREDSLTWRADQLEEALETGGRQLDPQAVATAREVVGRARERWALKGGRTVVSLAGATGSGKSSLFNALVGEPVAAIGPRRPTTASATAAVWGQEESAGLLDWLGVPHRHQVTDADGQGDLDGLVLIDLPDFDSRELSHRVEADRILARSDVFVWVTDPQKYADARLHEDYLATLRDHQTVMIVVLNQTDRVTEAGGSTRIKHDLRRLVAADGAGDFEVIGTSARIGLGVDDLRAAIASVVSERHASERRLRGDMVGAARELTGGVAPGEPSVDDVADGDLHQALARAAGIPVVLDAVRKDYLRQSRANAGWPFTRWLSGLRPDPLRRLRLGDDRAGTSGISPSDVRTVLGRSSLPPPSPAARSAVQLATRQVGERAGQDLPPRWADAVADAASPDDSTLADALDQAVMATPLRARNPFWWSFLRVVQLLLALTAVAGLLWLTVLAVLGYLQIDTEVPMWGPMPVPALMLVGGLLLGLVLALLSRVFGRVGASRRRALIGARLDKAVDGVAKEHVRRPVGTVLERHRQTRQQLQAVQS
jgi:GTP-binding protein EngB required for normal cell division